MIQSKTEKKIKRNELKAVLELIELNWLRLDKIEWLKGPTININQRMIGNICT